MSRLNDLFASKIQENKEKAQKLLDESKAAKEKPITSIFLQRTKASNVNSESLHAKSGTSTGQFSYNDLFSTKNHLTPAESKFI